MSNPVFLDLNGNTARFDPPGFDGYSGKLTLINEEERDDDGHLVTPPITFSIYLLPEDTINLATVLLENARGTNHPTTNKVTLLK